MEIEFIIEIGKDRFSVPKSEEIFHLISSIGKIQKKDEFVNEFNRINTEFLPFTDTESKIEENIITIAKIIWVLYLSNIFLTIKI